MLHKKVRKTIEKYSMLKKGDRVLVGVSGGPDSIALLHILNKLKEEYELELIAGHLNHGLRGEESDRDERFVKKVCKKSGIKCYTKKIKPGVLKVKGVSPEESARRARYQYFDELARRFHCNRIALGHNADDQAETVLMRFIRGSGLKGIAGIPPVRKNGFIIRPLIEIWRSEIEEFLNKEGIPFVIDSSNKKTEFLRNRYRHELIPYIEKNFNPNIKKSLVRMAEIFRQENQLLDKVIEGKKGVFVRTENEIIFNILIFNSLSPGKKLRLVRMAIHELVGDLRGFASVHFRDILKIAESPAPNKELNIPRNLLVRKEYNFLKILYNKKNEIKDKINVKLKINGRTLIAPLNHTIESRIVLKKEIKNLKVKQNIALLDYDKLEEPLFFRNYQPGDRFIPLGSSGTKKLKDFFIDLKIPLEDRYKIPILLSHDKIAWVVGYRIDERFKVADNTQRVLTLKIL